MIAFVGPVNVELVGVVNSSPESTARAAQEFGIPRRFDSPEQLIQSDEIDVVWIGPQPYLHSKLSIAALEAGKHVFCQARMALDYADAKRMYEAWRKTDLTANICAPPHYMRGDRVIRRLRSSSGGLSTFGEPGPSRRAPDSTHSRPAPRTDRKAAWGGRSGGRGG